MVEPSRSAGAKSSTTTTPARKKKLTATSPATPKPDKEKPADQGGKKQQSSHGSSATAAAADSPSYRLALRSLFSCRNSHAAQHQQHNQRAAPPQPAPAQADDASSRRCKKKSKKQTQLGCSASICKLRDASPRRVTLHRPPAEEEPPSGAATGAGEPCKRRASVSGAGERRVKKPLQQPQQGQGNEAAGAVVVGSSSRHWGSSTASSSSSTAGGGGSSFRLRRLSGCYECHMVVDPAGGGTSMRAAIFPCPDCGDVFVRAESLHLHQATRHAVSELGPEDTSRNIIEIIFQSSWLKKQTPVCAVDRILKVHNAPATLARFEAYRDAVKARARGGRPGAGRCTADGNELLRFHCAALSCSLGAGGATHLCDGAGNSSCAACGIVRDGFKFRAPGVRTMATSGRAHDDAVAVGGEEGEGGGGEQRRAMLVCRVIAGRVKRRCEGTAETAGKEEDAEAEEEYDSVAGTAGVYSSLDELEVLNPTAILPCFVVVYKA
ncbi:hypothetical protein VPH35_024995 [Triticum aestivum]|nr:uncharacterized protein LOC123191187 [Triticum aestivum]